MRHRRVQALMQDAVQQQRCTVGLHRAITAGQAKPFAAFYAGPECCGFKPFKSNTISRLIKQSLARQFSQLEELQDAYKAHACGSSSHDGDSGSAAVPPVSRA